MDSFRHIGHLGCEGPSIPEERSTTTFEIQDEESCLLSAFLLVPLGPALYIFHFLSCFRL